MVNTAQQWANVVFDMYPGYTGPRPRMQIYHGSVDNVLYPNNFNETVKQWSGVFGYSAPQQVLNGVPGAQYVKYIYGPQLEAIYGVGVGHSVNVMGAEDLRWFGIVVCFPAETSSVILLTKTREAQRPVPPAPLLPLFRPLGFLLQPLPPL